MERKFYVFVKTKLTGLISEKDMLNYLKNCHNYGYTYKCLDEANKDNFVVEKNGKIIYLYLLQK